MSHFQRITKNPKTGEFEKATWLDKGRKYSVVFPSGYACDELEIKEWRESYTSKYAKE